MNGLARVLIKELLQLRHDRRMIPILVIGPLVQLVVFGFAANTDVIEIPTLLVDLDRSAASRVLADRFTGSRHFALAGSEDSLARVDPWLESGRAQIALVIGAGFGDETGAGRAGRVQLLVDGTDASSAVVGMGYASRVVAEAGAEIVRLRSIRPAPAPGRPVLVPRVWYNPDLKSRWFYLPAILAMVLMLTTMILPSMAVVREKEIGTLEQLIVTPLRPWQLISGKLATFGAIGLLDLLLVAALVVWLFGVPVRGSFPLLVALSALFILSTLGLGLFVSTLVRTQQQAMMTSGLGLMVPMVYLSGLIFPIENMPPPIQAVTFVIPLRYYNNIVRGIFLRGAGLDALWPDAVVLGLFGAAVLALASLRFRKTLD